ncbi:hypothetical protein [Nocardioides sp. R-C-SC26]|uniref:hypothetical protein n=1 Tax=Nocardioides sp. R-C-SC26 TaxID=2870414 RepID=UPI001E3A2235|nr:hypothetical protein [Nocardioides sp. R-C-SC26]
MIRLPLRRLTPAVAVLVVSGLITVSACGGDTDSEPAGGDQSSAASTDAATDGVVGGPDDGTDTTGGGCTTSLTAIYPDGSEVVLDTSAAAVELSGGGAMTIYVGDYEIPTADVATETIAPPEGSHQASIFITTFDADARPAPLTSGMEITYTAETGALTFTTMLLAGAEMYGEAAEASGTVTLTEVGDDALCFDVDYADQQKAMVGTVSAPIYDTPF